MKVSTFIDIANIHNSTICLWSADKDAPGYSNCFYCGMEWELLNTPYADLTFKRLFGIVYVEAHPEHEDAIHIQVEESGLTKSNTICAVEEDNHENLNTAADWVCCY